MAVHGIILSPLVLASVFFLRGPPLAAALLRGGGSSAQPPSNDAAVGDALGDVGQLSAEFGQPELSASSLSDAASLTPPQPEVIYPTASTPRRGAWSTGEKPRPLVLMYETDISRAPFGSALADQAKSGGINFKVLGKGTDFRGFGSKYKYVLPELDAAHEEQLVVISDYEDVLLNTGSNATHAMDAFAAEFEALTESRPGSIVVSAEHECCVGSLTFWNPGHIIAPNGVRLSRTCYSGTEGCLYRQGGKPAWEMFMKKLARCRNARTGYIFLNAGLLAGRARDLARVIRLMQLDESEDDQAVMTELLFRFPKLFTLDYDQRLFGNARHQMEHAEENGCIFDADGKGLGLVHRETGSHPLFLHTSGKFFSCLGQVAATTGLTVKVNMLGRSTFDFNTTTDVAGEGSFDMKTYMQLVRERREMYHTQRMDDQDVVNEDAEVYDDGFTCTEAEETGSCVISADPDIAIDDEENQVPFLSPRQPENERSLGFIEENSLLTSTMRTFDHRTSKMDEQAEGSVWLVRSQDMQLQATFRALRDKVAIASIAVSGPFLRNHRLTISSADSRWNDDVLPPAPSKYHRVIPTNTSRGFTRVRVLSYEPMRNVPPGVEVELPMGVRLKIGRFEDHLDVKITMPRKFAGTVDGKCGNYNGDSQDDAAELIEQRMGLVMVPAEEDIARAVARNAAM
mmetsp:Transcript_20682/g.57698  ORF Transcript_20682/g.57698 Transcript_20682/m.57698 type:complete len:684 (+) Transcript_20682:81-2132(+)